MRKGEVKSSPKIKKIVFSLPAKSRAREVRVGSFDFNCYVFSSNGHCYHVTYNPEEHAPRLVLMPRAETMEMDVRDGLVARIGNTYMVRHDSFVAHLDTFYAAGRYVSRGHYRCLSSFIAQVTRSQMMLDHNLVEEAHP